MDQLSHSFEQPGQEPTLALDGVSLEIQRGEYVALVGENGSGKTTLARHLNALLLPTAGEVWIDGYNTKDPTATRAIRQQVGMVFQSPADQIVGTIVQEDVAFGPENLGVPRDVLPTVVAQSLQRMGMWESRNRPPHQLSVGQQQRVAIAGVLAMNPKCIVFDEATSMLDPAAQRSLLRAMDDLVKSGITVITITHSMAEAAAAERIIVVHDGHIVLDAPPREVFAVDALTEWGLDLPVPTALSRRLHKQIPALPSDALTPQELAASIADLYYAQSDH
jgi:energy-coupling factor transporter ATPase